MRRVPRGQALVELGLILPLLFLVVAVPVASALWGHRQLDALDRAREAAWAVAAGAPPPRTGEVRVQGRAGGLVRVEATAPAPAAPRVLGSDSRGPRPSARLEASLEIDTVALVAGTEAAGVRAVEERWLGGRAAPPLRILIKLLIRHDPVRVDFDVRPPRRGEP